MTRHQSSDCDCGWNGHMSLAGLKMAFVYWFIFSTLSAKSWGPTGSPVVHLLLTSSSDFFGSFRILPAAAAAVTAAVTAAPAADSCDRS